MKSNSVLLLLGIGVVAFFLWKKYATFANLQFIPRGISLHGGGFQVVMGVQNTSSMPVQYNSFAGSLNVNGSNVGFVSDFQPGIIQPNAETDITLTITPNVLGIASQVMTQLQGGDVGITSATLTGSANVGGTQYPVNMTLA